MPQAALKVCVATFTAVALTMVARPVHAQSSAPAKALLSFDEYEGINRTKSIDRSRLARLILDYCNDMLKVVPRNTPREEDWINEEYKSGNLDRFMRAMQSIEGARQSLVFSFQKCASHSANLTKLVSAQPTTEAVLWTRLAVTFSEGLLVGDLAVRVGLARYDEKSGWIDPHGFRSVPQMITTNSHRAVIESLGHKY